jgi:hypothetical protein
MFILNRAGAREDQMSANWKAVKEDLDWSINKGDEVRGRNELKSVIANGDHTSVQAIGDALKMGQRDGHKVANYLRCAHEDPKRLYAISRRLIGVEQKQ